MIKLIIYFLAFLFFISAAMFIISAILNIREIASRRPATVMYDYSKAFSGEIFRFIFSILLRPFNFIGGKEDLNGDGPPILLIHGLYHNNTAWIYIKPKLLRAGFKNIHLMSYNSLTTSYPELVLQARNRIESLCTANSHSKVMLIGHSLGGLIASGAVTDQQTASKCSGIITMGTPYRGSILAALAFGHLGRSLHPKSAIFTAEDKYQIPETLQMLVLHSPVDEMVLPWTNLIPPDAAANTHHVKMIETKPTGHVAMLFSSENAESIISFLKENS